MTLFLKKHKKIFYYSISCAILITLLILANFVSYYILPAQNTLSSISSEKFNLYLISLSKSQVKSEATWHAQDFQKVGAGGFIWQQDGYYHIISSGYLNKSDAELVQSSIKLNQNLDSQLLIIQFNSFNINGNFTAEETKVINGLLTSCTNYYSSIYDIAISLDTGVYNEITAKLAVNSAQQTFSTKLANFNTIFPKPHSPSISPLYEMASAGYKIGQKLCGEEKINNNQNYSSLLKYRYLEIMKLYYDFVNK